MTRTAPGRFRRRTRWRETLPAATHRWPGIRKPDADCGRHAWQQTAPGQWQCRYCTTTRATDPWAGAPLA